MGTYIQCSTSLTETVVVLYGNNHRQDVEANESCQLLRTTYSVQLFNDLNKSQHLDSRKMCYNHILFRPRSFF